MPVLDRSNKEQAERFDRYVRQSPWANATQDVRWSHVKADWGSYQVYLERGGEIVAALCIITKKVGGGVLAYAPRGPVCDPYDTELVMELLAEAEPLMKKLGAFALRLDPETIYDEELGRRYAALGLRVRGRGYGKMQLIQPRFNMFLNISGKTWEELMESFSEKTRYNVRLSERKGVTVRWSREQKALDIFYDLYKTTCERDMIGARPKDYFARMLESYGGDMMRFYIAEHEGEPLSAAIAINYGQKMWYIYGASGNEKRNLMPNYAMQAAMIKWGLEQGCGLYDFGGVFVLDKSNGLFKFKEGFCRSQGVTELIGELDMVYKPFGYKVFTDIQPAAQRLRYSLMHLGKKR